VEGQLATFAARARVEGPPVFAGAPFAQMFALVVHELATNAAKYGSLSQTSGRVIVTWQIRDGEGGEPQLAFSWAERDGPPVSPPTREGFGTRLILAALAGTPHIEFGSGGFEFRVEVPLADVTRASKVFVDQEEP
jgi:two-component sensor histidine kinase